jgi:hypothetical protein
MIELQPAGFPSRYLDCIESALVGILNYLGLPDETPLMGTQAYFVLDERGPSVYPRFHTTSEEWRRIHGLVVETSPLADEADLRARIAAHLDESRPVCLLTDIYFLPHTSHHRRLHQQHFIDVFGYDDGRYYMVCPYYRFVGWMDANVVHDSVFSPAIDDRRLLFVSQFKWQTLSVEQVRCLARESCAYMLGLAVPEAQAGAEPRYLGLAGIRAFAALLHQMAADRERDLPARAFMLSAQTLAVGYSRYWFHRLIESRQPDLLPAKVMADLGQQFAAAIRSWKAVGARFGAAIHAADYEAIERAARRLEEIHRQEYALFHRLLEALPLE